MENKIVEIGIKLSNPLSYYQNILKNAGAINVYNCETHDLYWTNRQLDGMSENEMKESCIRYRTTCGFGGPYWDGNKEWTATLQNYGLFDPGAAKVMVCDAWSFGKYKKQLENNNWYKVFDTYKKDYQYVIGDMKSRIQLQDIKNVGLLLYYDNPDLYHLPVDQQRIMLINELNSYGFNVSPNELGLDKLRTLWYKKECFSENQNN